jgi:hypothetical protein
VRRDFQLPRASKQRLFGLDRLKNREKENK